jgi:hypothetical protein
MTRIVFLDIDGVLNCTDFRAQHGGAGAVLAGEPHDPSTHLDAVRIERFNLVTEATGAVVVLSSSWRCLFGPTRTEVMLRAKGLRAPMIGSTPRVHGSRGNEIAEWLRGCTDVDSFVVLDDDLDARDGHEGRFVHVPDGLEMEHVDAAIRVLSGRCRERSE